MKKSFVLSVMLFVLCCCLEAQEYPTGDETKIADFARISKKDSSTITKSLIAISSLKPFCPKVAQQSGGTCFAYASAYGGRSILFNRIANDSTGKMKFSPGYIVRKLQRRRIGNRYCTKGASTVLACESIEKEGVVPIEIYPEECSLRGVDDLIAQAALYKAKATSLFDVCAGINVKVEAIKEALTNLNPVVLGMNAVKSFHRQNSAVTADLWEPTPNEISNNKCQTANHAICIIGFNDNIYGGVFEVMNSWGENWKNRGFTYVRYKDLAALSMFAIQLSN